MPKISEVIMQCRAWDMLARLDVIVIDYLTRIKPDKTANNQNLDVGEVVTAMKNMARHMNIPVIVLAQLNRESAKRANKKPTMADLRDSGIIEQEADCILLLHRDEERTEIVSRSHSAFWEKPGVDEVFYPEQTLIIVEKNRHGEAGIDLMVNFDKKIMRWF